MEGGKYFAFGIGVPLAFLGYLSYLKENSSGVEKKGTSKPDRKRKTPINTNAA
ncbi:MAG: hypothetical protein WAM14_16730 [Candidatus Nitrosopolaris sp.]